MKKIITIFKWITLPMILLLVLFIVTFIIGYTSSIFSPNDTKQFSMLFASAFGAYFSIKSGMFYSPIKNKYALFGICGFLLLLTGGAFVHTNMIIYNYTDNWSNFGNLVGIGAGFYFDETTENE